jgi:hypothetical protein
MYFDVNKDGNLNFGDVGAKAGEILTKKFDWDKDGSVEAQEVVAELGSGYAVGTSLCHHCLRFHYFSDRQLLLKHI